MIRFLVTAVGLLFLAPQVRALEPIPDKLVVLTFDDASKSHYTIARPMLLKHRFGATFFVTEGWDFATNKTDYMSWDEIGQLHKDGFEVGNHTRDHKGITANSVPDIPVQLGAINAQCEKHGIPRTTCFAYPGNAFAKEGLKSLQEMGIVFARRGGSPEYPYEAGRGLAYEPGLDHPLLIPTTGDARPTWTLDNLKTAVSMAKHGKIAVLQFHGVPDTAHSWVNTPPENFAAFMQYLADERCTVIAMRDLAKYVDPTVVPNDPLGVIEDRKKLIAAGRDGSNCRPAKNEKELRYWLDNAFIRHRFTSAEVGAALGLTAEETLAESKRLGLELATAREFAVGERLVVLPYPGGRHPRIGFLDGAIRPQRETKASVFAPWTDGGYAVADVPEAVWFQTGTGRELLYLAHTHVPTMWDKQGVKLKPLEWKREAGGLLSVERKLPNGVVFGTRAAPRADHVAMEMWLTNGTSDTLRGLMVQNCVMLKSLAGFDQQTSDNKVIRKPYVACRN